MGKIEALRISLEEESPGKVLPILKRISKNFAKINYIFQNEVYKLNGGPKPREGVSVEYLAGAGRIIRTQMSQVQPRLDELLDAINILGWELTNEVLDAKRIRRVELYLTEVSICLDNALLILKKPKFAFSTSSSILFKLIQWKSKAQH